MEYRINKFEYELISPGTVGVAQRISSGYEGKGIDGAIEETSKLVFLMKNDVMACKQNQY
ncbi:MAG: hypothetical protein KJ646_00295 [Nanoarchaeota archaeon]|nr:hypothetical protein [Nanoarchaeota archaeon]MBU4116339.1 hypothetical protein [Nanoarchaeota archaeon]